MLVQKQDPAAQLRAMIEGVQPLNVAAAKDLALHLASRIGDEERAAELCIELEDQLDRLWMAAHFKWPLDIFQFDAGIALDKLVSAGLH